MYYNDSTSKKKEKREATVTIKDLLYHTSGIPFESMVLIPERGGDDALEETVKRLNGPI